MSNNDPCDKNKKKSGHDISDPKSTKLVGKNCFWFKDGACFLYKIPSDWVYDFLARNPKARTDLLNCTLNVCDMVDPDWIKFAENNIRYKDERQLDDEWQKWANQFIDNHRQIAQGTVFRTPRTKGNESDGE